MNNQATGKVGTAKPRDDQTSAQAAVRTGPVVLCILDGWGHRVETTDNAIAQADTPQWNQMLRDNPHSLIRTSGLDVGLPDGQMGNSEVGHMNLGGGRVVMQDLPRINQCIAENRLGEIAELSQLVAKLKASGGACHLLGLLSPGGIHSHQSHIAALAAEIARHGIPVKAHLILDGRDTPPKSALEYVEKFIGDSGADAENSMVKIATVSGRFFTMDRDKRWDRVAPAYDLLVDGNGEAAPDARSAIEAAYSRGETDEFVKPTAISGYDGMANGDGLLMANFRADRAREILDALCDPDFDGFPRPRIVSFSERCGMTEYSQNLNRFLTTLFPARQVHNTLGELAAESGLRQLRLAETEKYAHVTFFFNGGEEKQFTNEVRCLIPSPDVKTYDLQPEMSAQAVTDKLVAAISQTDDPFDLIIVNYANPDMVGHTGVMDAAIKAAETIDHCLRQVCAAIDNAGAILMVTADHGNLEMLYDAASGQPHTAHTTDLVPLVLYGDAVRELELADGRLADIAPSLLTFLGLAQPDEMTGQSLVTTTQIASKAGRAAG